jgi:hypothetical protein
LARLRLRLALRRLLLLVLGRLLVLGQELVPERVAGRVAEGDGLVVDGGRDRQDDRLTPRGGLGTDQLDAVTFATCVYRFRDTSGEKGAGPTQSMDRPSMTRGPPSRTCARGGPRAICDMPSFITSTGE